MGNKIGTEYHKMYVIIKLYSLKYKQANTHLCVPLCSAEWAGPWKWARWLFSLPCWTDWSWLSHSWTWSWTESWCRSGPPGWLAAWWCLGTRGPSRVAYTPGPWRGPGTKRGAPHSVEGHRFVKWIIEIVIISVEWNLTTRSYHQNQVMTRTRRTPLHL